MPTPITTVFLNTIKVDAENRILLSGKIDFYDGIKQPNLIRLNSDGNLDPSFNSNCESILNDIDFLSTGEIIGVNNDSIYKISSSGIIIKSIKIEPFISIVIKDDNIYAVSEAFGFKKYNSNLNLDAVFKQDNVFAGGNANAVAIQGDNILVGGSFTEVNGFTKNFIARFDTDGNSDNTFETNYTTSSISSLMVQNDGKIIINKGKTRLEVNGAMDSSYALAASVGNGLGTALFQNDKILLVAYLNSEFATRKLIRLNNDGSLDNSFNMVDTNSDEMALMADNSILTGSILYNLGFTKYSSEGVLISEFSPPISSIGFFENATYFNGSIVLTGDFYALNDHNTYQIGKIDITGVVDSNFTVTRDIVPYRTGDVKIKDNDQIFVAQGNKLLKLDNTGNLVNGFNTPTELIKPNSVYNDTYFASKFQLYENEKIVTAGPNGVYLLNSDGSQDTNFAYQKTAGGSSTAVGLDLQSSGKIISGNIFTEVNNIPANGLVRVLPDGNVDESFDIGDGPNPDTRIRGVYVLQNDEIIVRAYDPKALADDPTVNSGGFNNLSSNLQIYKLGINGSLDTEFLDNLNSNFAEASRYGIGISYMEDSFIFNYYDAASTPFSLAKIDFNGNKDNNFSIENDVKLMGGRGIINIDKRMFLVIADLEIKATGAIKKGALFIDDNAPIVTGTIENLTTPQDTPKLISVTDLTIEDPDNAFPDDFVLTVLDGENYTVVNNTITPDLGFLGSLSINLVVNDGQGNSQPFQINIEVTESLGFENDFSKNLFSVYPNPIENSLHIKPNNLIDTFKIKISDTNGKLIYLKDGIKNDVETINLSTLQNGLYILQIVSKDNVETIKLLKK
ncbi:T9SS type A sorting domain-containing protein [Mariniflexile sp. HNIBRBA6329]|uniref:T9SS type A sorting domain-containing protein n=1 Tax=Mariniflexile sp. HNIBRBA6329 TaxID=3373088 RepID=UPI003746CEFD